jgi:hypothetical protein
MSISLISEERTRTVILNTMTNKLDIPDVRNDGIRLIETVEYEMIQ